MAEEKDIIAGIAFQVSLIDDGCDAQLQKILGRLGDIAAKGISIPVTLNGDGLERELEQLMKKPRGGTNSGDILAAYEKTRKGEYKRMLESEMRGESNAAWEASELELLKKATQDVEKAKRHASRAAGGGNRQRGQSAEAKAFLDLEGNKKFSWTHDPAQRASWKTVQGTVGENRTADSKEAIHNLFHPEYAGKSYGPKSLEDEQAGKRQQWVRRALIAKATPEQAESYAAKMAAAELERMTKAYPYPFYKPLLAQREGQRAAWDAQERTDDKATEAAQLKTQGEQDVYGSPKWVFKQKQREADQAARQRAAWDAQERKDDESMLSPDDRRARKRAVDEQALTDKFILGGMEKQAAATKAAAIVQDKYTEAMKKAVEPTTILGKLAHDLGEGRIRPGVARATTAGLNKLFGTPEGETNILASGAGAMTGALVSSLALPIAWALGNAIMNLPKTIGEIVDWKRVHERLQVSAGTKAEGEEWKAAAARSARFFGDVLSPENKYSSDTMLGALGAGQFTGVPENSKGAADLYMKVAATSELYHMLGRKDDASEMVAAMKIARTGTHSERIAAMQRLGESPEVKAALIAEQFKPGYKPNPREERTAEERATAILAQDPRWGGYSPEHLEYLREQAAKANPAIQKVLNWEREQNRDPMTSGWRRVRGDLAGERKTAQEAYINHMEAAESDIEERRKSGDWRGKGTGWYGQTVPLGPPQTEEQIRAKARSEMIGGHRLAGGDFYPVGVQPLSEEEAAALDKAAKGNVGKFHDLSTLLDTPDSPQRTNMPAQYNWTSFSGMAEQMQQMWSGAPIDSNTAAVNELTTTIKQDIQSRTGNNAGNHVVQPAGMPAAPPSK